MGGALEPSTTYEFRVRAHNLKGWGPWSSEGEAEGKLSSARTLCTPPLQPNPPLLKAFTTTSLTIQWEPPEDGGKMLFNYHLQCKSTQERGAHIQEWGLLPPEPPVAAALVPAAAAVAASAGGAGTATALSPYGLSRLGGRNGG